MNFVLWVYVVISLGSVQCFTLCSVLYFVKAILYECRYVYVRQFTFLCLYFETFMFIFEKLNPSNAEATFVQSTRT